MVQHGRVLVSEQPAGRGAEDLRNDAVARHDLPAATSPPATPPTVTRSPDLPAVPGARERASPPWRAWVVAWVVAAPRPPRLRRRPARRPPPPRQRGKFYDPGRGNAYLGVVAARRRAARRRRVHPPARAGPAPQRLWGVKVEDRSERLDREPHDDHGQRSRRSAIWPTARRGRFTDAHLAGDADGGKAVVGIRPAPEGSAPTVLLDAHYDVNHPLTKAGTPLAPRWRPWFGRGTADWGKSSAPPARRSCRR